MKFSPCGKLETAFLFRELSPRYAKNFFASSSKNDNAARVVQQVFVGFLSRVALLQQ
jgi:hypothetical protein